MKATRTFISILVSIFFFTFCVSQAVYAAKDESDNYSTLFQQVKDAGDDLSAISPALAEAFHNDPVDFINALAREDMSIWDKVGDAIVAYNTGKGNDLEFLKFILEAFASDDFIHPGRDAFLPILMGFHADVSGADAEFVNVLFNAMRYSDGISADKLGIYAYELFLDDPVRIVHLIMEQDEAFQEHMVITLNYQCYATEVRYSEILNDLSESQELSETEKVFVAKLTEKFASKESPTTETEVNDSIHTDGQNATEPVSASPSSDSRNILPIALAAILLIGFGTVVILKKKKSQNNA